MTREEWMRLKAEGKLVELLPWASRERFDKDYSFFDEPMLAAEREKNQATARFIRECMDRALNRGAKRA